MFWAYSMWIGNDIFAIGIILNNQSRWMSSNIRQRGLHYMATKTTTTTTNTDTIAAVAVALTSIYMLYSWEGRISHRYDKKNRIDCRYSEDFRRVFVKTIMYSFVAHTHTHTCILGQSTNLDVVTILSNSSTQFQ